MALRVTLVSYISGARLLIPVNPYPMYPFVEVLNHIAIDSATGHRYVFTHGPERVNASISFKNLSHDFVKEYERFLIDHLKLGQVPVSIECPSYIDFGLGKGEDISLAYYSGPPTMKDIITPRDDAGLFYDIEFPYMFVRKRNV